MAQRLHQAQYTVLARCAAEQHRTNLSLAQFTGEIVEDLIARRRNVLKKLLKQAIVMIGEFSSMVSRASFSRSRSPASRSITSDGRCSR
jgi:hypothetical protein